jgi:hypothetical protein
MKDIHAARALGWASLAIAATEIVGEGTVEKDLLGIDDHPALLPALGVREAIAGVTLLTQKQITPALAAGLWSRVAGDAMDLALLALAAPKTRRPAGFAAATAAVIGLTAADLYYAFRVQRRLMMAKVDVKHREALSEVQSPAAQPPV